MRKFLLWWLVNAISLFVVTALLPAVKTEEGIFPLLLVALLIGVINALVRPVLYLLSCGLIILTLGLIIPVLNALLLLLADRVAGSAFDIDGFGWAIVAALIMGFVNWLLSQIFGLDEDEKERKRKREDAR